MPNYHAAFKKEGSRLPNTALFTAKDVPDAITQMCSAAGVHSTTGIVEFEILEVLGGGLYQRVAIKTEKKARTVQERIDTSTAAVQAPPEPPPDNGEKKYVPYTIQLAA